MEIERAWRPKSGSATSRRWSGTQACHKYHGNQRDGSSGQNIGWKRYVKDKSIGSLHSIRFLNCFTDTFICLFKFVAFYVKN